MGFTGCQRHAQDAISECSVAKPFLTCQAVANEPYPRRANWAGANECRQATICAALRSGSIQTNVQYHQEVMGEPAMIEMLPFLEIVSTWLRLTTGKVYLGGFGLSRPRMMPRLNSGPNCSNAMRMLRSVTSRSSSRIAYEGNQSESCGSNSYTTQSGGAPLLFSA